MNAVIPMIPQTRVAMQNSVGRLVAATTDNPKAKLGTAFPISQRHLVTCRHCVPTDWTELSVSFPQLKGVSASFPCRLVWINADDDLAILMLDSEANLPPSVLPFEFSDSVAAGSDWWAYGYPKDVADGDVLSGTVLRVDHIKEDRDYIRLNCKEGEERLNGISGAPVVVGSHVVAVIAESGGAGNIRVDSVSFDRSRRYLAELTDAAKAHGTQCRWSKTLRPFSHKLLDRHPQADNSNLLCLIVEIKNDRVDAVKDKLSRLHQIMAARGTPLQDGDQIVAWLLLGSKEMLIQIRAQKRSASEIEDTVWDECRNDFRDMLEADIAHEFVPDLSSCNARVAPAIVNRIHIPEEVNSHRFKAFIHITHGRAQNLRPPQREKYLSDVLEVVSKAGSIVDLVYCNATRQTIIVELTLPCGQFNELFKLTGNMETGFRIADFQKSTYMAYDVIPIWPLPQQ